ncbi:MAG: DUF2358 domain-containing protein [Roseofilum sp. SBFL]|uniref:DUF2358 domain-containing protein n=1 Tax=unclassified Roseofilum TaxID=2620099 RepID=UPI001B26A3B3|nr:MULTISPECIES: DUF2358 domain-containing protein [unclassified Roseofilum]MBP0014170.1 DUF2358 domain-containing protein [Roseofilum sp. SID3]MBP0024067.1 DUF2358 domain-containing protein [Roseofilum sp. SID2]MBP0036113.1 DUF2358 domain-containing protein [Roseofilum sp. SID1]MBP0040698.1 DUF2358 domain-containing protein [Roseofilum sp. SBFL]
MELIEILKADYERFPVNPTYSIYAPDVYFKDPMTEFWGGDRYQQMISWMERWFLNIKMDLHHIQQEGNTIHTRWTLHWNTPLPWKPRISIPGSSELQINENGLINSHIDRWDISRLDVLKQHIALRAGNRE